MSKQLYLLVLISCLTGCASWPVQAGQAATIREKAPATSAWTAMPSPVAFSSANPTPISAAPTPTTARPAPSRTPAVTLRLATPAPLLISTTAPTLPPERWKEWPVMPQLSAEMREVYLRGLEQGRNPQAFSVFGDCQSQPDVFMGIYETEPAAVAALSPALQATVREFSGSFNRYSPTVKDGTTEGALLWAQWNDNKEKKCTPGETPVDCELRVHRPSIVFIHVGTHWEARNRRYLSLILDKIIASGAVPVLVTKADNRELDERVNRNMASLAAEYGVPLWNFWASVQHLPENGMQPGSDMYLSPAGLEVHRLGALLALDTVWRSASQQP